MDTPDCRTNSHHACPHCVSRVVPPHASARAKPDTQSDVTDDGGLIDPLEKVIEEERTRLMLANSVLGCLQTALDPEAVVVTPVIYFPEVLELARQFINKSVTHLEYDEIRRLARRSLSDVQ